MSLELGNVRRIGLVGTYDSRDPNNHLSGGGNKVSSEQHQDHMAKMRRTELKPSPSPITMVTDWLHRPAEEN